MSYVAVIEHYRRELKEGRKSLLGFMVLEG